MADVARLHAEQDQDAADHLGGGDDRADHRRARDPELADETDETVDAAEPLLEASGDQNYAHQEANDGDAPACVQRFAQSHLRALPVRPQ